MLSPTKVNQGVVAALITAVCLMIAVQGCRMPESTIKADAAQPASQAASQPGDPEIAQTTCNPATTNTATMLIVNDENNGQGVTLNRGHSLQVRLASNPGTGYGWQLVENNVSQLKPVGNPVLEPPPTDLQPGSTIYQVFRFQAQSPGSSVLELQYRRPGQTNNPPEKTYRLTVQMLNGSAITTVAESDNNREVRLATGDTLQVRLPTNSSAGYGWQVVANNPNQLKQIGAPVIEKPNNSQLGGMEYQVFRFQVQSAGASSLEFQYRRAGQPNSSPPEKTYRIHAQTLTEGSLIRLTESDNDATVRITPGNTLIVRLTTNPSTGYVWQVAQNNADLLEPLGNPVLEQIGTQAKVFCFQGQSAGSSVLEFQYRRPWEKNQPPLNIYRLNVQVR